MITECSCDRCKAMCTAPCCGKPEDFDKLIAEGYGSRLMIDDWPGDILIKPAMKGYEGQRAPWSTRLPQGCTFWKDGLCELHDSGLKPTQGKLCHHSYEGEENLAIADYIRKSWQGKKAKNLIAKWKKEYFKDDIENDDEENEE